MNGWTGVSEAGRVGRSIRACVMHECVCVCVLCQIDNHEVGWGMRQKGRASLLLGRCASTYTQLRIFLSREKKNQKKGGGKRKAEEEEERGLAEEGGKGREGEERDLKETACAFIELCMRIQDSTDGLIEDRFETGLGES